jgi:hypothetical protein
VLFVVGKTGVDSPAAVEKALEGAAGEVDLLAMRPAGDKWEPVNGKLSLAGGGGAIAGAIGSGQGGGPEPQAGATDPVNAYFDMLDFTRSQSWGRKFTTDAAERGRVEALLKQSWGELPAEVQQAIGQLPKVWADVRKRWADSSDARKEEQRAHWRVQLLLPTTLYPPLEATETFRGKNDTVILEYPGGWIQDQQEAEGTQYLYIGPPGGQASWQQVLDPAATPPGALFVVTPLTDEIKGFGTFLNGAKAIAKQFVVGNAPDMKQIAEFDLGKGGAIVAYAGRYPGQAEDKFYWVGCVQYGSGNVFIARIGGTVAQAAELVPAYFHILSTLELHPRDAGGGEGAMAVSLATSIIGNAVAATNW